MWSAWAFSRVGLIRLASVAESVAEYRFLLPYFEKSAGRIWEEPGGYLRLEYRPGPREAGPFRALLMHTAQALSRRQWSKLLVDQRVMDSFIPSEREWMATEGLPRAVYDNGYRFGAVVVAQNVFARLAMTQLVPATCDLPHIYRTFEAEAEAVAWLVK